MRTNLKEDETLIINVKRHWCVLVVPFIIFFVVTYFFLVPPQLSDAYSGFNKLIKEGFLYTMISSMLYLIYIFLERKYNIWVVTDRRVIDECGIITHEAKESLIEKINNVNVVQTITGRVLGYGDVEIQTAATYGETWIGYVERPKELQEAILKQIDKYGVFEDVKNRKTEELKEIKETKECPFCSETILKKAKICRFCGRELQISEKKNELENPILEENPKTDEDKDKVIEKFANPHLWKRDRG